MPRRPPLPIARAAVYLAADAGMIVLARRHAWLGVAACLAAMAVLIVPPRCWCQWLVRARFRVQLARYDPPGVFRGMRHITARREPKMRDPG